MKISTKRLAYTAVFIAFSIVVNALTIYPAGNTSFAITFSYTICFIAGIFLGPYLGFLVGSIGDLLGCLIFPHGAWIPTITLAAGLLGMIPGFVFKIPKLPAIPKIIVAAILCFCICTVGINTPSLWFFSSYITHSKYNNVLWGYVIYRVPWQSVVLLINTVIICVLYPFLKPKLQSLDKNPKASETVPVTGEQIHPVSSVFESDNMANDKVLATNDIHFIENGKQHTNNSRAIK